MCLDWLGNPGGPACPPQGLGWWYHHWDLVTSLALVVELGAVVATNHSPQLEAAHKCWSRDVGGWAGHGIHHHLRQEG